MSYAVGHIPSIPCTLIHMTVLLRFLHFKNYKKIGFVNYEFIIIIIIINNDIMVSLNSNIECKTGALRI